MGDDASPPGWDYNPASWPQRLPIIGAALAGFGTAMYLAAYQIGWVSHAWDPFFGAQTEKILDSPLSRVLPVPDALLGAMGYLADAVAGAVGGKRRWRTMPWVVVLFGLLVGPLGAISIGLVIAQPLLYDAWCTLCIATAFISVIMIGPAMDEVLASLQHLRREHSRGRLWRAFWGLE